jgi:methyl-accepting chemotaxis protein
MVKIDMLNLITCKGHDMIIELGNSVVKKLSWLIGFALIGIVLLLSTSFFFFGRISQISNITRSGYLYEVTFYQVLSDMDHFLLTQEPDSMEKVKAGLKKMVQLDSSIGDLQRSMDLGQSEAEAAATFTLRFGKIDGGDISKAARLVKTLHGKPILDKMVQVTDHANVYSKQWRDLLNQYVQEDDEQQKENLLTQMTAIQKKYPELLFDFHAVLAEVSVYMSSLVKKLYLTISVVVVLILAAMAFLVSKSITEPLKQTVDFAKAMSLGDFRNRLEIKSKDELGQMADAFNTMTISLRGMLKGIIDGISTINTSSNDLSSLSQGMSKGAQQASGKSNAVEMAAEKMSAGMNGIASAMEQSATNVNMVASSAEEMSSSICEIAQTAEKARSISDEAAGQAAIASTRMNELGQAAQSIGKVIETITEISEQVNLLALNATIEAARAGEAGKGFAVVANEIKELAKQTASAAQDIRSQIENIQGTTASTVTQMKSIAGVINNVHGLVGSIASAVEEQSSATKEIAVNIGQASHGIQEVNENVNQSSILAAGISKEISSVHQAADDISNSSTQVYSSAQDLAKLSQQLKKMVDRFAL